MEVACQGEGSVSSPCRNSSFPREGPLRTRGAKSCLGLVGRVEAVARLCRKPAGGRALTTFPGCSLLVCRLEARSGQPPKLGPQGGMAKSRGRLYLWMCLAAVLASFLAGFMVGKYEPRVPRAPCPQRGAGASGSDAGEETQKAWRPWRGSLSCGQPRGIQPSWNPGGMTLTFLIKCD